MKRFDAFCWRLRAAMAVSGLSREEVAARVGVKVATLKSWIVGRRSPTVRRLIDLASALGIDPAALFEATEDLPQVTICGVCGHAFPLVIGYRIHVALKAKDCPEHARIAQPAARGDPPTLAGPVLLTPS